MIESSRLSYSQSFNRTSNSFKNQNKKTIVTYGAGSCSKIIIRNGRPVAICFDSKNNKNTNSNSNKKSLKSLSIKKQSPETKNKYTSREINNKRSIPYTPEKYKNPFTKPNVFIHHTNYSQITIGNKNASCKNEWKSVYKSSYKRPKSSYIANQGMLVDIIKREHYNHKFLFFYDDENKGNYKNNNIIFYITPNSFRII